jgi:protein-arginine deiminase
VAFQKAAKCNQANKVVFKSRVPFQVQVERLDTPLEGREYTIEAADGETFRGKLDAEGKTEEVRLVEGTALFSLAPPEDVRSGDGADAEQAVDLGAGATPRAADEEPVPPPELTIVDPDDPALPPTAGVFLESEARFKGQVEPEGHDPTFSWTCADGAVELVDADQQVVTVRAKQLPADPEQELELTCKVTTKGGEDEASHTFKVVDVRLHLDADRDGEVDDDTEGLDAWAWGEDAKGAIVLCNADDEGSDGVPDYESESVDSTQDAEDLAPLDVRRPGGSLPEGWSVSLEAGPAGTVRVFSARAEGALELIGPKAGDACSLEDMAEDRELALEGLRFPHKDFPDGEITLTLKVRDAGSRVVGERTAVIRVAPWMMLHHLMASEQVYVSAINVDRNDGGNREFREHLAQGLTRAGLGGAVEVDYKAFGYDRWMQDAMEVGFTSAPGQEPFPVALRTANDRGAMSWGTIDRYPRQELLGPDFGWVQALPPARGTSLDSFGNLEVSPPVEVNGQKYPFGRIVYGEDSRRAMRQEVIDFLRAQRVQAPFGVDTSWLKVGHVDEFLTFLPAKSGRFGFKLGLASPRLAMEILRDLSGRGLGGVWLFEGEMGDYVEVGPSDDAATLLERYQDGLDPHGPRPAQAESDVQPLRGRAQVCSGSSGAERSQPVAPGAWGEAAGGAAHG